MYFHASASSTILFEGWTTSTWVGECAVCVIHVEYPGIYDHRLQAAHPHNSLLSLPPHCMLRPRHCCTTYYIFFNDRIETEIAINRVVVEVSLYGVIISRLFLTTCTHVAFYDFSVCSGLFQRCWCHVSPSSSWLLCTRAWKYSAKCYSRGHCTRRATTFPWRHRRTVPSFRAAPLSSTYPVHE